MWSIEAGGLSSDVMPVSLSPSFSSQAEGKSFNKLQLWEMHKRVGNCFLLKLAPKFFWMECEYSLEAGHGIFSSERLILVLMVLLGENYLLNRWYEFNPFALLSQDAGTTVCKKFEILSKEQANIWFRVQLAFIQARERCWVRQEETTKRKTKKPPQKPKPHFAWLLPRGISGGKKTLKFSHCHFLLF